MLHVRHYQSLALTSEQLFIGKIALAGTIITVHCCIQHAAECDNE